jgi:Spy/CpxP family protein refolding chaperone
MGGGGYGPGYGMGPGMMGGYGPGGMGPGMMGGFGPGAYYGLDLTTEQRAKIGEIRKEFSEKQWELMGKLHAQGGPMDEAFAGPFDEKAARKAYESMADAHKKMFEASLQMRKRIEAVLTPEQRQQMGRGGRGPR